MAKHSDKILVRKLLMWGLPLLAVWLTGGVLEPVPEPIRDWLMSNIAEFAGIVMVLIYKIDKAAYNKFVEEAELEIGESA